MLQNKIYLNYFVEIFKTFFTIILGLSLIALTVRAVNFLELMVDNGYSLSTYFKYSFLNIFGIAPKFFPLAFLIALAIFIIKNTNNNEFVILWTTGVKKIVIVNLLLFSSFVVMILYLIFSTYLTPFALNQSREMISNSKFESFLPTIRTQQFSDSFKGLTFFVEKKIDNEIKNIFIYDTGNNLKNFSSSSTNFDNTTIIAEKGIVKKKGLFLINGEIISARKNEKKSETIKFDQLNIDLKDLQTTVIKKPKLQETPTLKLLGCFTLKNFDENICRGGAKDEIIPVLARRLVLPLYIPVITIFCSLLLFIKKNSFINKINVFTLCFIFLVLIELILKYTGTNIILRNTYFFLPILLTVLVYPLLMYRFSKF